MRLRNRINWQIGKLFHACLAVRRNQRFLVIAVLVAGSSELLPAFQSLTPHQIDGDYIGLQSMPNISPDEKDAKWFHENKLLIRDKQVVLDMSPVYYQRGKKWHSASDGGFMTYRGVFFRNDGEDFVRLRLFQSDYVLLPLGHKPYEELHVYPVKFSPRSIEINSVQYKRTKLDPQTQKRLLAYLKKESVDPPPHER